VGPIFFEDTINSQRYILSILRPFFELRNEHDRRFAFFQQDSATPHTARDSVEELRQVFGDRIVSRGLWPARSPDLNPCDFYLWGNLKQKVYKTNPHTIEELKENIRNEVSAISPSELQRVITNLVRRCQECARADGDHFQHLL
jgi:inhibitor of nuclear factor kappa-B kinase subunit alpha